MSIKLHSDFLQPIGCHFSPKDFLPLDVNEPPKGDGDLVSTWMSQACLRKSMPTPNHQGDSPSHPMVFSFLF